jgi:hypothetical protein
MAPTPVDPRLVNILWGLLELAHRPKPGLRVTVWVGQDYTAAAGTGDASAGVMGDGCEDPYVSALTSRSEANSTVCSWD